MQSQINVASDVSEQLALAALQGYGTPVLYKVRPGDRVSRILHNYYGALPGTARYREAELTLRYFNPALANPDYIVIGQTLKLLPLPPGGGSCPIPADVDPVQLNAFRAARPPRHYLEPASPNYVERIGQHIPLDPAERDAFFALAWLEENYRWLAQPAGVGASALGLLTGPGNVALVREVGTAYDLYKRGVLTKGQYDYRRRTALQTFSRNVGPMERLLFKGQTANEVVRISRLLGIPATHRIEATAARLGQMARYATRGGVVLAGAGLYMACREMGRASGAQEKNEIMVEAVGSTAVGAALSLGVAIALTTTPVGWGVALVLAAGTAVASYGGGVGLRVAYDRWGQKVDFADRLGVSRLCS